FRAQRLELHGRQAAGSTADNPLVETALRLEGAVADQLHPLAAKPIDADIAATLRGVNDISPKPWAVRFKEWQARGGQIEITKARLAQEDVIAVGSGILKLTPRGGLDGDLQVTVVGIEKVLKMFDIERIMSEGQIGATFNALDRLIPGLGGIARQSAAPGLVAALGQRAVLEGKPAVAFPVRFTDGAVFLGPFPGAVSGGRGAAAVLTTGTAQASKAFVLESRRARFARSASRGGTTNGGSHADRHVDSPIP